MANRVASELRGALAGDAERLRVQTTNPFRLALLALTSPAFSAIAIARVASLFSRRGAPLGRLLAMLNLRLNGADIDPRAELGSGLLLQHPVGVVIGGGVRIGKDCTVMSGAVFGRRLISALDGASDYPKISDRVFVGANATILGGIEIGSGCKVAAGSVVLIDLPAGATAFGNSASVRLA